MANQLKKKRPYGKQFKQKQHHQRQAPKTVEAFIDFEGRLQPPV